jgi:hypothetical protein
MLTSTLLLFGEILRFRQNLALNNGACIDLAEAGVGHQRKQARNKPPAGMEKGTVFHGYSPPKGHEGGLLETRLAGTNYNALRRFAAPDAEGVKDGTNGSSCKFIGSGPVNGANHPPSRATSASASPVCPGYLCRSASL